MNSVGTKCFNSKSKNQKTIRSDSVFFFGWQKESACQLQIGEFEIFQNSKLVNLRLEPAAGRKKKEERERVIKCGK